MIMIMKLARTKRQLNDNYCEDHYVHLLSLFISFIYYFNYNRIFKRTNKKKIDYNNWREKFSLQMFGLERDWAGIDIIRTEPSDSSIFYLHSFLMIDITLAFQDLLEIY